MIGASHLFAGSVTRQFRCLIAPLVLLLLTACADRPGPELLQPISAQIADSGAHVVTIYVATTRNKLADDGTRFGNGRANALTYAEYHISIPPNHKPGAIEWPQGAPDPRQNFVTVEARILDEATFRHAVETRRSGNRKPDVGVFVHGYNTNFQEALYRMAQLASDSEIAAVPILFAWPSEAKVTSYVADKDAVTFSRDRLVDLLTMLGRDPQIGNITLTGHSMGCWLTAEALRQLRLTGKDDVIRRFRVILAAPDIDVDVFRAQMDVIGPLTPPMVALVSKDDVALSVSEFISGARKRVGALDVTNPTVKETADREHIQIVDISNIPASDSFKHDRFAELAALLPRDVETRGDFRQAGVFVFDAVGATLSSPFTLASRVVGGE
jgi:esterase/lipase superfamily enzyme